MTTTVATRPPAQIIAGDSVAFTLTYADYPAPTWSVTWALAGVSSKSVDSTDDGTDHAIALSNTETAALGAGTYQWRTRVTDGTTVTTVETGTLVVTPDIGEARPGELVSWEETTLPIVEAALKGTLEGEMKMYMIQGRQVMTFSPAELWAMRAKLRAEVARQRSGGQLPAIMVGRWKSYDGEGWE